MQENAQELRERAAACETRRAESIENSDTDGFASQWGAGKMAELYRAQAQIAENGGTSEFMGLYTLGGQRVKAKMIRSKYGHCWALLDAEGRFTGVFLPAYPKTATPLRIRGYAEKMESAPAGAKLDGPHACSVRVIVYRTDGGYPPGSVIA